MAYREWPEISKFKPTIARKRTKAIAGKKGEKAFITLSFQLFQRAVLPIPRLNFSFEFHAASEIRKAIMGHFWVSIDGSPSVSESQGLNKITVPLDS